jgi:hypothetical protein
MKVFTRHLTNPCVSGVCFQLCVTLFEEGPLVKLWNKLFTGLSHALDKKVVNEKFLGIKSMQVYTHMY